MWTNLSFVNCNSCSPSKFLSAIDVYLNRPHILNDRIIGAKVLEAVYLNSDFFPSDHIYFKVKTVTSLTETSRSLSNIFPAAYTSQGCTKNFILRSVSAEILVCRRKLFPKVPEKFSNFEDVVIIDVTGNLSAVFIPVFTVSELQSKNVFNVAPVFTYAIIYKPQKEIITLEVLDMKNTDAGVNQASCRWLQENVFKRIVKWSNQEQPSSASLPSLSLVPVEKYFSHRQRLKNKYAKDIIEKWTESTDPLKFVHEDIAIAAYLLTVWECECENLGLESKQSFVDLGCGNGLLAYILSSEGHRGLGLDLKKRAIWNLFDSTVKLVESSLIPSQTSLFPDYDWLIGNHSDELTPWIPVIASRSSYSMRVFLLPCCAYTFDGKYQRTFPGSSQYQSYLNFVQDLCENAGFKTQRDKLRIPSTKRVCFVCMSRAYPESAEKEWNEKRREYIARHSRHITEDDSPEHRTTWIDSFKPREKVEAVRNCTQLDRKFLDDTVNLLARMLLSAGNEERQIQKETGVRSFQYGGHLTIQELAERLDSETKQHLKQQCGGLQTLLRNHRHIFQICENQVSITTPISKNEHGAGGKKSDNSPGKKMTVKHRQCWFYFNHPQGCPLEQDVCRFLHSKDD